MFLKNMLKFKTELMTLNKIQKIHNSYFWKKQHKESAPAPAVHEHLEDPLRRSSRYRSMLYQRERYYYILSDTALYDYD